MTAPEKKLPQTFYTYLWLRENGTPYYVGKGFKTTRRRGRAYRRGSPPEDHIIVQEHESEEAAFFVEKFLINFYGRKDIETGCLINLTEGGEGAFGSVCSEETKRLLSEQRKGKPNLKLRGIKRPDWLRKAMSEYRKGKPIPHYDPQRHSELMLGAGNPIFGKKRVFNAEWLRKLGEGRRGHSVSEETRKKMSEAARSRVYKNQTHCHRGHEFTPENTWIGKSSSSRHCLQCRKIRHDEANLCNKIRREAARCLPLT